MQRTNMRKSIPVSYTIGTKEALFSVQSTRSEMHGYQL